MLQSARYIGRVKRVRSPLACRNTRRGALPISSSGLLLKLRYSYSRKEHHLPHEFSQMDRARHHFVLVPVLLIYSVLLPPSRSAFASLEAAPPASAPKRAVKIIGPNDAA